MSHLTDDEMTELYYAESTSASDAHLRVCREMLGAVLQGEADPGRDRFDACAATGSGLRRPCVGDAAAAVDAV